MDYEAIRTILDAALTMEARSRETYKGVRTLAGGNGEVVELLAFLEHEEEGHYRLLLKKRSLYGGDLFQPEVNPKSLPGIEKLIGADQMQILEYCIGSERFARDRYESWIHETEDIVVRGFLRFLAGEESKHEALLIAIKGNPATH